MHLVQSISKIKKGYIHIDPNSFTKTRGLNSIKISQINEYGGPQTLNQT